MYVCKKDKWNYKVFIWFFIPVLFALGFWIYEKMNQSVEVSMPVNKEVLYLESYKKEKVQFPFQVEATIVQDFYDEKRSIEENKKALILFEGVYRPSFAVSYAYHNQNFKVYPALDGRIKQIKEDELLGNIVVISSDDYEISYRSLSTVLVKEGQNVNQGHCIGYAGENKMSKDLGNHLEVMVIKNEELINPNELFQEAN